MTLAVAVFVVHLGIERRLADLQVIYQYDVLFHTDTLARLQCSVEDRCQGRSSFPHPNLPVFQNPPTALGADVLVSLGAFGTVREARMHLSRWASPLATAVKASLVFLVLLELGIGIAPALLLSLLSAASFSELVFGSVPEALAPAALGIAAAFWLAVRCMKSGRHRPVPWLALGILSAGITLTNAVSIAVLYGATRLQQAVPWRRATLETGVGVLIVLVVTAALALATRDLYDLQEISAAGGSDYVTRWVEPQTALAHAVAMPASWARTIAAPRPLKVPSPRAIFENSRYKFMYSFEQAPGILAGGHWPGVAALLMGAFGAVGLARGPSVARWIGFASLGILAFNLALHTLWGPEVYLYSSHWQQALIVPIAGIFLAVPTGRRRAIAIAVLSLVLIATVAQNSSTLAAIFEDLQRVPPRGLGTP